LIDLQENSPECIGCGKMISDPSENNRLGEDFICDTCREEMISSLEGAWKRHSAFLDSALN
jgi:hypothetical protein